MTVEREQKSKLDRLAEALIEETLSMSEEEMLADDTEGPDQMERTLRSEISSAVASHRRHRLMAAKAAVLARRRDPTTGHHSTGDLRTAINEVIANDDSSFTLAARDGRNIPDADLEGLAEDLSELGFDIDREKDSDAS